MGLEGEDIYFIASVIVALKEAGKATMMMRFKATSCSLPSDLGRDRKKLFIISCFPLGGTSTTDSNDPGHK